MSLLRSFISDNQETTGQYGVQEVLLASVCAFWLLTQFADQAQFMAAFVASFFGGQPLLISGVTGEYPVVASCWLIHLSITETETLRTHHGLQQDHLRYIRGSR